MTDPNHDHIPAGQTSVRSDTGELTRDWKAGIQTIDTPRTQAVSGWIGGQSLALKDATFRFKTAKAVVALSSIDDQPLDSSRFILVTAVGQSRPSPASDMGKLLPDLPAEHLPFQTEPVAGTIVLRDQDHRHGTARPGARRQDRQPIYARRRRRCPHHPAPGRPRHPLVHSENQTASRQSSPDLAPPVASPAREGMPQPVLSTWQTGMPELAIVSIRLLLPS